MRLEKLVTKSWYESKIGVTWWLAPLLPLSNYIVRKKRRDYEKGKGVYEASYPVIVIGNVTVGGTGKSPMVAALCQLLISKGYSPAIVSKGYGANVETPVLIDADSSPTEYGDEPVMLAKRTGVPVCVCKNRVAAVKMIESKGLANIIICDDGMQHYKLGRDVEIAMVDARRGLGNGKLLPVGPLREPASRLENVDFIFSIGGSVGSSSGISRSLKVYCGDLQSTEIVSLKDGNVRKSAAHLATGDWHAVAGIGNPERFWRSLTDLGMSADSKCTWFPDHHRYVKDDLPLEKVVMTEKDAVKCAPIVSAECDWWYLPVALELPHDFSDLFMRRLENIVREKKK